MKRSTVVWVCLAAWLSSCANQPALPHAPAEAATATRPAHKATSRPPAPTRSPWVTLLDGTGLERWAVVRGKAACRDGVIRMDASGSDVTLLANGVDLRDGVLEVELRRRASQLLPGPVTVGLRLVMQWNWSSLYFVCRPEQVEVCRGSSQVQCPAPEYIEKLQPEQGVETWRFEMRDGQVLGFRDGQKVISYADTQPAGGSITLTASHCDVDVLSVRYRPSESDLNRLATRPASQAATVPK